MPEEGLDDLLQPTLTEADDLSGFDRPWNPWNLLLVVFFAGPLFGGALAAWNFRKLGMPRGFAPAVVGFVLIHFLFFSGLLLAIHHGYLDGENDNQSRLVRNAGRLLWVLVGLVVAIQQKARFRVYEGGGQEPGKVLPLGVAAFLLNILTVEYQIMIVAVVLALVTGSGF